jgi:hypothetical protein
LGPRDLLSLDSSHDAVLRDLALDPGHRVPRREIWAFLEQIAAATPQEAASWVSDRASWVSAALTGIEIRASHAIALANGEDASVSYPELCALRSGLENLRHGFLAVGLDDPAEMLDLRRWDDALEILAQDADSDPATPLPGVPPDHWWWRAQTDGRPENKDYDPWDPETY